MGGGEERKGKRGVLSREKKTSFCPNLTERADSLEAKGCVCVCVCVCVCSGSSSS